MGLGTIFVVTPTVGWALPLLWPIVISAAGALGYKMFTSTAEDGLLRGELTKEMNSLKCVSIPLDQVIKDMVADEIGREQVLRFAKDQVVLVFKRDMRGKFAVEIMGPSHMTAMQLRAQAMDFASTVIQQFAYNKMAVEMERRGANVVGEEVTEDGDIVLKLRKWD